MIESTLNNIKKYLEFKFQEAGNDSKVYLETLKKDEEPDFGVYITLLRIEEETSVKKQNVFHRDSKEKGHYANPDICVNLFVLISVFEEDYPTGLSVISSVLRILNNVNDFAYLMSEKQMEEYYEDIDTMKKECYEAVKALSIELQNMTAEQTNSMWQTFGTKVVPAVCYKIRMLTITDSSNNVTAPMVETVEMPPEGTFKKRLQEIMAEEDKEQEAELTDKEKVERRVEQEKADNKAKRTMTLTTE